MRARNDSTAQAASARTGIAGRSRTLFLVLAALATVLAASWFLFSRPNPTSAALEPPRVERPEPPAQTADVELASATRSSVTIAAESPARPVGEGYVNSGDYPPAAPPRFTGQFVFEDGSIPPELSFGMDAEALLGTSAPDCARTARERTDSRAQFRVEGLCPGTYAISHGISGLPPIEARVVVPSDTRVVLGGYLVRVRVRARDGTPAVGATIEVQYVRPPIDGRDATTARWDRRSDEHGEAWFGLPEPGTCTVSAFLGLDTALAHEVDLSGPSRVVDVPIVLAPSSSGAVLRVEMRGCDSAQLAVQDYCIELLDPATGVRIERLCSNDARPDQVFADLKPGRFEARAVPKFSGRPVLYRAATPATETIVELTEGRETTVRMCVELGGRLSVLVHAGSGLAESKPELKALLEIEREDGSGLMPLDFRAPTETGVMFARALPFGTERFTENILEPGTYKLTAHAVGHSTETETVIVRAGEITRVTVLLQKQ